MTLRGQRSPCHRAGMRSPRPITLAACLAVTLAACSDEPPAPPRDPIPSSLPATTAEDAPPSSTTSEAAQAAQDAGADAGVSLAAVAGAWEGAYEAKKGRVGMPEGVADPARAADDGKVASGPGTVTLTITPDGDVTGKSGGALGDARIRGKIDGKMLRTSFVPDDPTAPRAMTGVLVGIVKGDTITAELRVAGPDALLVRQANFDLKKK